MGDSFRRFWNIFLTEKARNCFFSHRKNIFLREVIQKRRLIIVVSIIIPRFENIWHLPPSEVTCPVGVWIVNHLRFLSSDWLSSDVPVSSTLITIHMFRFTITISSMTRYQQSEKGSLRERRNICNGFGSLRRNCLGQAGHLLDHQILTYVLWGAL